jgi:hypothetical protein
MILGRRPSFALTPPASSPPSSGDPAPADLEGGGGGAAIAAGRDRGVPLSGAASPERDRDLVVPDGTPPPPPPPLPGANPPRASSPPRPVVRTLLPVEVAAEKEEEEERALEAANARASGLPVPLEAGDDRAVVALKGRLARLHLEGLDRGMHGRALAVLDEVASGDVKVKTVGKDGEIVEVDLHPQHRIAAARGILGHAASISRSNGGSMKIENANVIAAGDLIAQVDPDRLRKAIERIRSRGA